MCTEIIPLILINMGVCIIYNQYKNVEYIHEYRKNKFFKILLPKVCTIRVL